jgi:hypothetical protein
MPLCADGLVQLQSIKPTIYSEVAWPRPVAMRFPSESLFWYSLSSALWQKCEVIGRCDYLVAPASVGCHMTNRSCSEGIKLGRRKGSN